MRILIAVTVLIVLGLSGGAYWYWHSVLSAGELGSKDAYSYLQGVEFKYRGSSVDATPMLLRGEDPSRDVLGLPTGDDRFPRAWLLLNRVKEDGSVLLIPEGLPIHVSCAYVESVTPIDDRVRQFLLRTCAP